MYAAVVNILGDDFEVEYEFQPEEPEVRYYSDGSGYPGCSAAITGIIKITRNGEDWTDIFSHSTQIVEDAIWESIANYEPEDQ